MGIGTAILILLIVIVVGVGILIIGWVSSYNRLVKYRNWVEEAWGQIDVQLKRRYDLIPNLVETVKGYAQHEQETLTGVIEARQQMNNPDNSRNEQMAANNQLEGMMGRLFALREDYPDLKANQNFQQLQEELTSTENKIAYSRQLYNNTVMEYNTKIQSVPTNFIASAHNFIQQEMLETPEEQRENVKVDFNTGDRS
ncbi:LemA family protein [Natribacillus halophilus]|uniref:LemA protein n=1 Tax=Natribacillus halophilus TaxID=549003 RepID=A0A1G8QCF2_9BACI|nr:LemA family protein [Natribacillus halophilus]SDJ02387.1 LemA protein [Natribacillus halophilus]